MNLVVDTNVLVSGLLNPYGPPGRIVHLVADGELALCFDARVLGEYREVLLRPKFDFRAEHVEMLMEQIRAGGVASSAKPLAHALPDRSDEPFLEIAIAAQADYLVTGNPRHFPVAARERVRVIAPAEFIEVLRVGGR